MIKYSRICLQSWQSKQRTTSYTCDGILVVVFTLSVSLTSFQCTSIYGNIVILISVSPQPSILVDVFSICTGGPSHCCHPCLFLLKCSLLCGSSSTSLSTSLPVMTLRNWTAKRMWRDSDVWWTHKHSWLTPS